MSEASCALSSSRAVISIDFGTSRSGFAYAFPSDDGSIGEIFQKIYPEDGYHKQPTCLYVDVKQPPLQSSLLAFGHKAREMMACDDVKTLKLGIVTFSNTLSLPSRKKTIFAQKLCGPHLT